MNDTTHTKRPYAKKNPEYWKNRKSGSEKETKKTPLKSTPSEPTIPTVFNRFGLQLTTNEILVKKFVDKHVDRQEKEQYEKFRCRVTPEFQKFLSSIHQSVVRGDSTSNNVIPKSLGTVVSDYCKDWDGESETVLERFSENCLRTFVGVMSVLDLSGRHILKLEQEIVNLRTQSKTQPTVSEVGQGPSPKSTPPTVTEVGTEKPTKSESGLINDMSFSE